MDKESFDRWTSAMGWKPEDLQRMLDTATGPASGLRAIASNMDAVMVEVELLCDPSSSEWKSEIDRAVAAACVLAGANHTPDRERIVRIALEQMWKLGRRTQLEIWIRQLFDIIQKLEVR